MQEGLQQAVQCVTTLLGQPEVGWKAKATIICEFAEAVSNAVLARCCPDADQFNPNRIARMWSTGYDSSAAHGGQDHELSADYEDLTHEIWLVNVPPTLSLSDEDDPPIAHMLLFGDGRVLEWDKRHERCRRVMTYEEAARYIIFWLAEKILQISRKNNWDRIRQLPDLYDRLAALTAGVAPKK